MPALEGLLSSAFSASNLRVSGIDNIAFFREGIAHSGLATPSVAQRLPADFT
ncbi:hypothetical protein QTI66_37250 [Variovorax sp. J22R133]|uniref:hypothetical protein n=1 Tax=Variovorax brevis TaxID=3053503 RepID=UPI0025791534|nr:hypothetical protein [Variovorax sp. J22R133]MDM0117749.1 hypothetical protein [Variovorax sp. J22R133]